MGALFGLLFLAILFGGHDTGPKCPELWPETKNTYKPADEITAKDLKGNQVVLQCVDGRCYNFTTATVTVNHAGQVLVQTGTTTDKEAVEHNKRVRECQTINGEF